MKILYISNSIIPSRTANSIQVMKMCQAFVDNNHEVTLLAPNIKTSDKKEDFDIHEYYGVKKHFVVKKLFRPNIIFGATIYTLSVLFYLLTHKGYDLVYGRFLHGTYIASIFKKVIFEIHTPIFNQNFYNLIVFKRLIKNKNFKKLIVISNTLKQEYLKKSNLDKKYIKVAHDGADKVLNFKFRIKLFGKKKNLKVGYFGHLYKGKGMEIIDSIASLVKDNVEIHIIGGVENDLRKWKDKIKSKNVFFYGFVPHQKISNYINALDICLLPNQKIVLAHGADDNSINISDFTSPLKLFEYMAHKKSIISSDLKVLREVLNEKNSVLVECDNPKEWALNIHKLSSKSLRKKIANQALKDFNKYSWKKRAQKVLKFSH